MPIVKVEQIPGTLGEVESITDKFGIVSADKIYKYVQIMTLMEFRDIRNGKPYIEQTLQRFRNCEEQDFTNKGY